MRDYKYSEQRIIFNIRSSIVSSFQSDTIFGHICWAIRYIEGKEFLEAFLDLYNDKNTIPLILSNGFLEGYLPKPILPSLSLNRAESLVTEIRGGEDSNKIEGILKLKELKTLKYIPSLYIKENNGTFSQKKMCEDFLKGRIQNEISNEQLISEMAVMRNSIDRITGRAMKGLLFSTKETFYHENSKIVTYIKLREDLELHGKMINKQWLRNILTYIEIKGYGADYSQGKGDISIDLIEGSTLPQSPQPNAVLSLSNFVPDADDPQKTYYHTMLKFGKLGEHYSTCGNPFKKPILMLEEGSILFLQDNQMPDEFYGRMIRNVHSKRTNVLHYALLYPLALRILRYE